MGTIGFSYPQAVLLRNAKSTAPGSDTCAPAVVTAIHIKQNAAAAQEYTSGILARKVVCCRERETGRCFLNTGVITAQGCYRRSTLRKSQLNREIDTRG
jgi:hypothetical protein